MRASWEPPEYPDHVREALSHVLDEWAEQQADFLIGEWNTSSTTVVPPSVSGFVEAAFRDLAQRIYDHRDRFDKDQNRDWMWHTLDGATRFKAMRRAAR